MQTTWCFFLVFIPFTIGISLKIDGTINLGSDSDSKSGARSNTNKNEHYKHLREGDNKKSVGLKMIDIFVQKNHRHALSYPAPERKRKRHKRLRSRLRNTMLYDSPRLEPDATTNDLIKDSTVTVTTQKRHVVTAKKVSVDTERIIEKVNESIANPEVKEIIKVSYPVKVTKIGILKEELVTTPESEIVKAMYVEPHKVHQVDKIKDVTNHIYEGSIKVFDNIKDQINDYVIRNEIEQLKRSYAEKFGDFVRDTQDQKVKTRLGHQKVVLNTMDTSNRILSRLINHLRTKIDEKGALRNQNTDGMLQNELNNKKELDSQHLCAQLHVCRTDKSFTNFVVNIFDIILTADDKKIKEVSDAITEVLKNTDMSHVLGVNSEKHLQKGILDLEKYDTIILRAVFSIMKNMIAGRHTPLMVVEKPDSRVNKTLALMEILEMWDKKLPPTEQNILAWDDMTNGFREWKEGKRHDIVDLVQAFTDHVMKAINSYDEGETKSFEKKVDLLLGY